MVDEAAKRKGHDSGSFYRGLNPALGDVNLSYKNSYVTNDPDAAREYADESGDPGVVQKVYYRKGKKPPVLNDLSDARNLGDEIGVPFNENYIFEWLDRSDVRNALIENGYSLVEFIDQSPVNYMEHRSVLLLNPNQIKSADPVTHDEQGNIAPLSQRFNPESDSILFAPREKTVSDELQRLREFGRIREDGTVLAPNGQPSQLFEGLLERTGNRDQALDAYAMAHTPAFKERFGDWEVESHREFLEGRPVTALSGQEFQKSDGESIFDKVSEWFEAKHGGIAMNPILGRVVLDRKGVENSWGHGPGRFKAAAFAAVPDVIAKGRIIDRQTNWKKRGYNTVVLVAPVKIGKDARVVAVVVEQRKDNRFYLHEAYLKESLQKGLSFKTGALLEPGASTGDIEKIVRHIFSVNPESVSKRVDQNGEPLPDAVDGDLALFAPQQIKGTPEQEAIRERVSTDLLDRRPLGQRISEWFSDRSERAQEKSIIGLFDNLAGIRFAIERAYGKGAADLMDAIMNPWKFAHATTREIRTMFEGWFGSDRIVGGTYRYENGDIIHNKGSKGLRAILSQLVTKDGSLMKLWESYVTAYRGNQVTLQ